MADLNGTDHAIISFGLLMGTFYAMGKTLDYFIEGCLEIGRRQAATSRTVVARA